MHEDVCIQHANLKIKGQPRTASEVALRCLHEMPHTLNQETSTSLKKYYLYMCGGMGRKVCHGVCVVVRGQLVETLLPCWVLGTWVLAPAAIACMFWAVSLAWNLCLELNSYSFKFISSLNNLIKSIALKLLHNFFESVFCCWFFFPERKNSIY